MGFGEETREPDVLQVMDDLEGKGSPARMRFKKDPRKIAEENLEKAGNLPTKHPDNWVVKLQKEEARKRGELVTELILPKPKKKYQRVKGKFVTKRVKIDQT